MMLQAKLRAKGLLAISPFNDLRKSVKVVGVGKAISVANLESNQKRVQKKIASIVQS